jgi:hypothetical protein
MPSSSAIAGGTSAVLSVTTATLPSCGIILHSIDPSMSSKSGV